MVAPPRFIQFRARPHHSRPQAPYPEGTERRVRLRFVGMPASNRQARTPALRRGLWRVLCVGWASPPDTLFEAPGTTARVIQPSDPTKRSRTHTMFGGSGVWTGRGRDPIMGDCRIGPVCQRRAAVAARSRAGGQQRVLRIRGATWQINWIVAIFSRGHWQAPPSGRWH